MNLNTMFIDKELLEEQAFAEIKAEYSAVIDAAKKIDVSKSSETTSFAYSLKTGCIYNAEATPAILLFNDHKKVIADKDSIVVITHDAGLGAEKSDIQLFEAIEAAKAA